VRHNLYKFALIVVLGCGFALAQSSPQQPATPPSSSPQTDQQQPSTAPAPDQSKPETLPNTDQKKPDDTSKMPQSDAAPNASTGDVQSKIQTAIQKDPTLASANVTVDVKDGKMVELSGTVPNKDAKETAERIAKENATGLKVKNHLKVASTGNDTAQPPKH
jgi:cytoskeletal protein RodZ